MAPCKAWDLRRRLLNSLEWHLGAALLGAMACLAAVGYVRQSGHSAAYVAVLLLFVVWADIWGYQRAMRFFLSRASRALIRGVFAISILSAFGAYVCLISRVCPLCGRGSQEMPPALHFTGPIALVAAYVSCAVLAIVGEARDPLHKTRLSRYCATAAYAGFALAGAALTVALLLALAGSR